MANEALPTCASCGRAMEPRRTDRPGNEPRKFCSAACRKRRVSRVDAELEAAILELLEGRAGGATVCPSEAARKVRPTADDGSEPWRALMEPARRAARRLCARGDVEITQKGRRVDPSTAKGPIRIRRR